MRLLQRAENPLYIHVQEGRVSGRELTSAKLVVTQLTSAKRCREAGFGEVGRDEVSEVVKSGSRSSARYGQAKCVQDESS
jgi:hypothetical protein